MKSATARRILACHVDDPNGDIPPLMQSALKALANEPDLQADYDEQSRIDSSLRSAFKDAEVPQEALTIFASQVEAIPKPHFNPRDPTIPHRQNLLPLPHASSPPGKKNKGRQLR